jgi:hypothetical protein
MVKKFPYAAAIVCATIMPAMAQAPMPDAVKRKSMDLLACFRKSAEIVGSTKCDPFNTQAARIWDMCLVVAKELSVALDRYNPNDDPDFSRKEIADLWNMDLDYIRDIVEKAQSQNPRCR